jgi:hypothetical protein
VPLVRVAALLAALVVASCAAIPNRVSYTLADQEAATVDGMPADIRVWADAPPEAFTGILGHIRADRKVDGRAPTLLALSGGADDGAYGAGFLSGWSETGRRPEFTIVSGISTGALIAPYAFLGPAYDGELGRLFTTIDSRDIFIFRGLRGLLGESIADSAPLREIVDRQVTPKLLAAIAAEHRKGRRLLVATTNLDAQRTVIWDMGAIASVGTPRALEVFRKVLLGSASVPAIFPPVFIDARSPNGRFNELHVDGGATVQVFTLPPSVLISRATATALPGTAIYMIINNSLAPSFEVVRASTLPIAGRSFSTLIKSSARQTVIETYDFTTERKIAFNLTFIGSDFTYPYGKPFDKAYMNALYEYGVARGRSGEGWLQAPPFSQ